MAFALSRCVLLLPAHCRPLFTGTVEEAHLVHVLDRKRLMADDIVDPARDLQRALLCPQTEQRSQIPENPQDPATAGEAEWRARRRRKAWPPARSRGGTPNSSRRWWSAGGARH